MSARLLFIANEFNSLRKEEVLQQRSRADDAAAAAAENVLQELTQYLFTELVMKHFWRQLLLFSLENGKNKYE